MGTAGGFDEEYCGQMMVVSPIAWQLHEHCWSLITSISTAMQGARASFKHGHPARARSSHYPVSLKRLTSFKRPAVDFHKRILFSDEAHFWLNDYANKQNCRIWNEANLQVYVETPLHPEKLTVWCALWAGGILLQKR
ncbi:hypothetical protein TNCV_1219621 [Trichonephila clavipes]|nr:hypothetical protein TNCV_1219621 [Trichonephila clavipes]